MRNWYGNSHIFFLLGGFLLWMRHSCSSDPINIWTNKIAWRIGSHHFPQYNKTPQQNWIQLQYHFAGGPKLWVHSVNFTQEAGLMFGELTSGICPYVFKEKIPEAIGNRISRWPNMLQWLSAVGGFYIRKNRTPVSNVSNACLECLEDLSSMNF